MSAGKIFGAFFTLGLTLIPDLELYKHLIKFDGKDADWGSLSYASDPQKTEQTK